MNPNLVQSFERQRGLIIDGSAKIDGGVENVDLAKGLSTGMALDAPVIIADTESRIDKKVFDMEKFMAEELEIQMHDPSNETEPTHVELNVNGDYRIAVRSSQAIVKLKRYHVAILAQAKSARLVQTKGVDSEGFQNFNNKMSMRQSYPFSVMHDPSGKVGSDWLRPLISNVNA